jgi:pyridoxine 4-dehydrogenase
LIPRDFDREMAFIPWSQLPAGQLVGGDSPILRVAERLSATPSQVALAWLLARSPVMLPIPGTSIVKHLEENVAAAGLKIGASEMQELDCAAHG